jgi:hypothetical protein
MCRNPKDFNFVEQGLRNQWRNELMYEKVTARRGGMDGKMRQRIEQERPIAKPDFPLPMAFYPSKRSELPTRRQTDTSVARKQQAHFYRKERTDSGSPVYDFFITEGPEQDLRENH